MSRGVAFAFRDLGHVDFAFGKLAGVDVDHAEVHAVPSRLNAGSGGRTDWADRVETSEFDSVGRHAIKVRRLDELVSIEADVAKAEIVSHKEDDVWFRCFA